MSRLARHTLAALSVTLAVAAAVPARAADLSADFGPAGLTKLAWRGTDLLSAGRVQLQDLKFDGGDATGENFQSTSDTFDAATHVSVQTYPWGTVRTTYRPAAAGVLRATIEVANTGPRSLTRCGLWLLRLHTPTPLKNAQWDGGWPLLHRRADDFPVVAADWTGGRLAVCGDDLAAPATFGLQPADGGSDAVAVQLDDGQSIRTGQTWRTTISLRVAPPGTPTEALVGDVLHAYAARYPATLRWPDRRPIGSAFLATSARNYPTNPRGWFLDPNVDVTTDAGRATFDARVAKYTQDVIAHCKKLNAQGVIVWDLEGQEMPHATSYLADPRMLKQVAPEMDAIADAMFKTYAAAGLRTGVTIRPTRVVKADGGRPGWMQQDTPDPIAEMDAKITYAHQRWGCTVFYLDSNVTYVFDAAGKILDNPTMPAEGFARLAGHHKNCLLIPEHKTDQYYAATAPYSEFRQGFNGTPDAVRVAYPHAFSVLQVVDGPNLADPGPAATLTAAIRHGDVLLFRPWWDDPQTTDIEHLYAPARPRAGNDRCAHSRRIMCTVEPPQERPHSPWSSFSWSSGSSLLIAILLPALK